MGLYTSELGYNEEFTTFGINIDVQGQQSRLNVILQVQVELEELYPV